MLPRLRACKAATCSSSKVHVLRNAGLQAAPSHVTMRYRQPCAALPLLTTCTDIVRLAAQKLELF
jgi:hypothetical protein